MDCLIPTTMRHSGRARRAKTNTLEIPGPFLSSTHRGIGAGDGRLLDVDCPRHFDDPQDFGRSQASPCSDCHRGRSSDGVDSGRHDCHHHRYGFLRGLQG